jgi:hypothetical protein
MLSPRGILPLSLFVIAGPSSEGRGNPNELNKLKQLDELFLVFASEARQSHCRTGARYS